MENRKLASMLLVVGGLTIATGACSAPADETTDETIEMSTELNADGSLATGCAAAACDAKPCAATGCSGKP